MILLAIALVICVIPFYGYVVEGGTHDQYLALLIIPAWLVGICMGVAATIVSIIRFPASITGRACTILLIIAIGSSIVLGFGGVTNTFWELWQGE